MALAGTGALIASESKPHGEKPAEKGHGEKAPEKAAAKPAEKSHGEGHGEKPAAAPKPHAPEATKPPAEAAHKAPVKPKPVAKAKPVKASAGHGRPAPSSAVAKEAESRPQGAEEVYAELKAGNRRFVSGKMRHPNLSNPRIRQTGRDGDRPLAVLLCCADSRVAPELVFDQGVGDLFAIRVAGNVANGDEIGSVEYAVDQLHAPLVVVMGHTECDAVKAIVEGRPVSAALDRMVANIRSAFLRTRAGAPTLKGKSLLKAVGQMNVWASIEETLKGSATVRDLVRSGELKIIGAEYLVETGEVSWMGPHPDQCDFV